MHLGFLFFSKCTIRYFCRIRIRTVQSFVYNNNKNNLNFRCVYIWILTLILYDLFIDFVVGSYMSDTVSVFRTRPIINLSCTVNVNPVMIPLNSSGLECQDEHYRPCATVEICFRYHGINIPEMICKLIMKSIFIVLSVCGV